MMTSAERDYFDPRDPRPLCDICDEPMDRGDDPEPWLDWNGKTGNHITCEEQQVDKEDHWPHDQDGLYRCCGVKS